MKTALAIGQIAFDQYYDSYGEPIARLPGGTAFNAAASLQRKGFILSLAATLGRGFPEQSGFNHGLSETVESSPPVSHIHLTPNGTEDVDHVKGDYI